MLKEEENHQNNWKKIKKQVTITSKINNRISSMNFIGEDLKFSEDSLEGKIASTLQLGINQIKQNKVNNNNSGNNNNNSNNNNNNEDKDIKVISRTRTSTIERINSPLFYSLTQTPKDRNIKSLDVPLEDTTINKYSFLVNDEECIFTEYYPEIFSLIRSSLGIDLIEYKAVLGLNVSTEFSKLEVDENDLNPFASIEKAAKRLDKKINESFTTAINQTEGKFKTLFNDITSKLKVNSDENNQSQQQPQSQEQQQQSPSPSPSSMKEVESNETSNQKSNSTKNTKKLIHSTLRFIGTRDASGKSSSWFLFSPDMRYCCKTAKQAEAELLIKILPSYASHCETYPETLLPHFYGLYQVEVQDKSFWFIIQGNVFASPNPISERYDVKGSTHGRLASEREKSKGVHAIHKDLDLISNERFLIVQNRSIKEELLNILTHDVRWLEFHHLMDYSFLLGFVNIKSELQSNDRFAIKSIKLVDERFSSVYVGLIDILTEYKFKKKVETFVNGTLLQHPGISCQPPTKYANRLLEFIDAIIVVIPENENENENNNDDNGGNNNNNENQEEKNFEENNEQKEQQRKLNENFDENKLQILRSQRKLMLEELIERNSGPLEEWLEKTKQEVVQLTEKIQITIQTEIEKVKEIHEKNREEGNENK